MLTNKSFNFCSFITSLSLIEELKDSKKIIRFNLRSLKLTKLIL